MTLHIPYDFQVQAVKPRCRNTTEFSVQAQPLDVAIPRIDAADAPEAFRFYSNHARAMTTLRFWNGQLWEPALENSVDPKVHTAETLTQHLRRTGYHWQKPVTEAEYRSTEYRQIIKDEQEHVQQQIRNTASRYVFIGDHAYEQTTEPRYEVKHHRSYSYGGIWIEVVSEYGNDVSRENYFSASDYDAALAYAKEWNARISEHFGKKLYEPEHRIEVLLPEAVRCKPLEDGFVTRTVKIVYTTTHEMFATIRLPEQAPASGDLAHTLTQAELQKAVSDPTAEIKTYDFHGEPHA